MIGIPPLAQRVSGQRKCDVTVLHCLIVIQRGGRLASRWVSSRNSSWGFVPDAFFSRLAEVEEAEDSRARAMLEHIGSMGALLVQQVKSHCTALEECGKKMFERQCLQWQNDSWMEEQAS